MKNRKEDDAPGIVVEFRNEEGTRGFEVFCEKQEPGYYLGGMRVLLGDNPSIGVHVELVEVTKGHVAKNGMLQDRVDNWHEKNECCVPRILTLDHRRFFVHMEVYAA